MKKLKWIPLSLNIISSLSFILSAVLLSTYSAGFFLTIEWIAVGFFIFFSIFHSVLPFLNGNSVAKDIVYLILTPLKAFMPILGYCFSFNVGWPYNESISIAVLVLSALTISISTLELFTDDVFYILSDENNDEFRDRIRSRRKPAAILAACYSVLVLFSLLETTVGFLSNLGTGVYLLPFLPIGDDMIVEVEPNRNFLWYGIIVLGTLIQVAFYLKSRSFRMSTTQNTICVTLIFLSLEISSHLCGIHESSGSSFLGMLFDGSNIYYQGFLKYAGYIMLIVILFAFVRKSYLQEKSKKSSGRPEAE